MSKNLKITLVVILVGCGGSNIIDVQSLAEFSELQIYTNSIVSSIGILSLVIN